MGIYDREYSRDDQPGMFLGGERMVVTNLVLFTIGLYFVDLLFFDSAIQSQWMALSVKVVQQPWRIYGLLTYGFAHASDNLMHLLGNMIGLWFFGRAIEETFGRKQFLWIYLTAIIFAGAVWLVATLARPHSPQASLVGASGGVVCMIVLFALLYPKRTVLVFGVLPVPAWALGVFYVVNDLFNVAHPGGSNVAFVAHLGGAAYALLFYKTHFSLAVLLPKKLSLKALRPKPNLRVHDPDPDAAENEMTKEVDRILEKIQTQGQDSLTAKEQKALERASRRYQQKHR